MRIKIDRFIIDFRKVSLLILEVFLNGNLDHVVIQFFANLVQKRYFESLFFNL